MHVCVYICVCACTCSLREGAAGASAVISSDSSTAYGRARWRMGAVTRQSAYPPTGESSHPNTMRKRRKQLNISIQLIYFPTATSFQECRNLKEKSSNQLIASGLCTRKHSWDKNTGSLTVHIIRPSYWRVCSSAFICSVSHTVL